MPGSLWARPSCPALSTKAHTANGGVLPQGVKSAKSPAGRKKSVLSFIWRIAFSGRWSFSSRSGCRWPGRSVRIASTPSPHAVVGREPLRVPCYRAFEGGQMCHGVASLCIVCWLSKFSVVDTGRPSTSLLSMVSGHRDQNSLIKSRTADHLCPESISYSYTSKHLQTRGKKPFIFSVTCLQHPIVPMVQMKFLGVHRSEESCPRPQGY